MSRQRIAAFPDTNLFLHYRSIEEVDWCSLLETASVEFKIAPVVVRELEKQKTLNPSRKIRDRAATTLKLLHSYLRRKPPSRIRDGVTLDFLTKDPTPEFAASHGLNLQIEDDRLAGTLLMYRQENLYVPCVLITHDLALVVKAHPFEIEILEPSDTLLLPPEPDETEKKLQQAQAELLRYKSREPELSVRFEGGGKHARFRVTRPSGDSEAEIRSMVDVAKQKHPLVQARSERDSAASAFGNTQLAEFAESLRKAAAGFQTMDQEFGQDYNARLNAYYCAYDKYLRDTFAFKELALRTIKLELTLENSGTCPAEDVHVLLHFPSGFTVYDEEHPPKPPEEPAVPSKELSPFANVSLLSSIPDIHSIRSLQSRDPTLPTIRKTNSYDVTFQYEKLQHGFAWSFTPLYVAFDSWDSANSFAIDYGVHAGNMIADQYDKLDVIVEKA